MHTWMRGVGGKGEQAQVTRSLSTGWGVGWGGMLSLFSYTWKGSDSRLVEGPSSKHTCSGFCRSSSRPSQAAAYHLRSPP